VHTVLLLSVCPGFGGQEFMSSVLPKVACLRARSRSIDIEVDGGINQENAHMVAAAGANAVVAGTTVFCWAKAARGDGAGACGFDSWGHSSRQCVKCWNFVLFPCMTSGRGFNLSYLHPVVQLCYRRHGLGIK